MAEIEIKSTLVNDKDFVKVKESLIKISEIDHEDKFRVKVLEYINDSSNSEDDEFFFDMLEFVRYLYPDDEAVAYTTPEHLIYLNCPKPSVVKSIKQWDFVYDHECLHQLWDTFGVANKIKERYGDYDHNLLNIASDCVINDYLYYYRKKDRPDDLITPELLREKYGVDYERKNDTQFTLYVKLKQVKDKQDELFKKMMEDPIIKKALEDMAKEMNKNNQQNNGSGKSGQQSDSQNGSGNGNSNKDIDNMSGKEASEDASKSAGKAKDAADKAKDAADKAKENGVDPQKAEDAARKAENAANKAKEAAKKAKEAADAGDDKTAKEKAKEARDAAKEAENAANEAAGKKSDNKNSDNNSSDKSSNDKSNKGSDKESNSSETSNKGGRGEDSGGNITETEEDLEKIKHKAEDIIKKYSQKISGDFGEFINKCKKSQELKESGLGIGTYKGTMGWNQKMNSCINAYVKKKVFQKKREFKKTYTRVKRGSGFIKQGMPIQPGKRIREEKLTINVAFYIDRSGSMSGEPIKNVFKAAYTISDILKKNFSKEKVVDEVSFKIYAFDTDITPVKWGNTVNSGGGTMPFDELFDYIKKTTSDYLINIIITDAETSVNKNHAEELIKDINGMLLFIANNEHADMKELSKKFNTQLYYILADGDFTIK